MKTAFEDLDNGIIINAKHANNIRYADDTTIFADSLDASSHQH